MQRWLIHILPFKILAVPVFSNFQLPTSPITGSKSFCPKHALYGRFTEKFAEIKNDYMNGDENRKTIVLYRATTCLVT